MKNTSNDLRELIRTLVRGLGILEKSEASCCGVSLSQCHCIVEIGRKGETSLNELASILNLNKSTMSRTINNLVKQDLVERKTNPEDRRYMRITLTDNGNKIYTEIEENMTLYFEKFLDDIPGNKRYQVMESVQLLLEAIEKNECCK